MNRKPDSHECDHPFFHRRGNSYNGCTPLPALSDRAIFSECKESGKSIIDFPESWGDDLMDVNQVEVDKALKFLKPSFGL